MYLLDTNVISELRKVRHGRADVNVTRWARKSDLHLNFISAISILELSTGTVRLERRDPVQGAMLREWLKTILIDFQARILPVDIEVAQRCAPLHVPDPKSELDALIAATALVHRLTVVTRNTADFAKMGVKLLNPWNS